MNLGADIGGSKTLLGVGRDGCLTSHRRYANADFPDFTAVLASFLEETATDPKTLQSACLALAGPIADDGLNARLTNLPWSISARGISEHFGIALPRLVNDFEAAAIGAVGAGAEHLVTLQAGEPLAGAPRLVVGAGTGLGMAVVVPDRGGWRCIPGEGGHIAFAPADDAQAALWASLQERYGRVTWERVVSGSGLTAICEFLGGQSLPPERIVAAARHDPAGSERRALDLFLAAYGAFAGDMALACLARGGVFLAGGIAAGIADLMERSRFRAVFQDKAEHRDIAARMPIHIVTDPLLGLRGAMAMSCDRKP